MERGASTEPAAGGGALRRGLRRGAVGLGGGAVLALGVAMVAAPGPAVLVIPLGLSILGTEFAWARRCRERLTRSLTDR